MPEKKRCPWCLGSDAFKAYHDDDWGSPATRCRAAWARELAKVAPDV